MSIPRQTSEQRNINCPMYVILDTPTQIMRVSFDWWRTVANLWGGGCRKFPPSKSQKLLMQASLIVKLNVLKHVNFYLLLIYTPFTPFPEKSFKKIANTLLMSDDVCVRRSGASGLGQTRQCFATGWRS